MAELGGCGAWRLFIRERTVGTREFGNVAQLSEQYRVLGDEERRRLTELGREGAARRAAGHSSTF
eukprot:7689232-Pyramimonas_sp.AAC.1